MHDSDDNQRAETSKDPFFIDGVVLLTRRIDERPPVSLETNSKGPDLSLWHFTRSEKPGLQSDPQNIFEDLGHYEKVKKSQSGALLNFASRLWDAEKDNCVFSRFGHYFPALALQSAVFQHRGFF